MPLPITETVKKIRSTTSSLCPLLPQVPRFASRVLAERLSIFSSLRRNVGFCESSPQSYHAPVLFFLARRYRLAYLQMPKVACTSIKTSLCLLNRPELAKEKESGNLRVHIRPELSDVISNDAPELLDFFRFTFVREPYARFVSFYWSKIVGKDGNGPVRKFRELGYTPGMTLDAVLDKVESTPEHLLDSHLLPQSAFLIRDGKLRVDFIGRIERFSQDLALVEARTGAKLNVAHLNRTKNTRPEDAERTLTKRQKRRVARLYAKDFELLGYEV